jgi:hypothetical protein
MAKKNKTQDLLRVLGQRIPQVAQPALKKDVPSSGFAVKESPARKTTTPTRAVTPKGKRGKAVQFWLHSEDEKLIRELAVWLAPHRKRINDSLVVKAVLRAVKTGPGLLAGYDDALTTDGRSKSKPKTQKYSV